MSTGRFEREIENEIHRCWNLPGRPYDPMTGWSIEPDMSKRFKNNGKPNYIANYRSRVNKNHKLGRCVSNATDLSRHFCSHFLVQNLY